MQEVTTATVIPFPARNKLVVSPDTSPTASSARLATALTNLSDALQEQRAAMQRWRDAMARLSASLQALHADSSLLAGQVEPEAAS